MMDGMNIRNSKTHSHEIDTDLSAQMDSIFHKLADYLKSDRLSIIDSFIDLSNSRDPVVIAQLAVHLEPILDCICSNENGHLAGKTQRDPNRLRLIRTLLMCNRVVRKENQWRYHEKLLNSFSCLSRFFTNEELCQNFMPMIKDEILTVRSLPCRLAALKTMLKWTRDIKSNNHVQPVIDFCKIDLAEHKSCHKRILFLDACKLSIECISKQFFKRHFFATAIQLSNDPVLNVRMKLCKLLPLFKSALVIPGDGEHLLKLNAAIKMLLAKDSRGHIVEVVMKTIYDLVHIDCSHPIDQKRKSIHSEFPYSHPPSYVTGSIPKNSFVNTPSTTFSSLSKALSTLKNGIGGPKENKQKRNSISEMNFTTVPINDRMENQKSTSLLQLNDQKAQLAKENGHELKSDIQKENGHQNDHSKIPTKLADFALFNTVPAKKVAVIKPRQIRNRSPTPRPSSENESSKEKILESKKENGMTNGRNTNERIIPIRIMNATSSNTIRPPTPPAFRRMSVSTSSLPRSSEYSKSRIRNIPIHKTNSTGKDT